MSRRQPDAAAASARMINSPVKWRRKAESRTPKAEINPKSQCKKLTAQRDSKSFSVFGFRLSELSLIPHLAYFERLQSFEKLPGAATLELGVFGFNTEK